MATNSKSVFVFVLCGVCPYYNLVIETLINKEHLFGFWDLVSVRTQEHDHAWVDETVLSGSAAFSDSQVVYASRTTEVVMGFTGTYAVEEDRLYLHFETSTFQNLENSVVVRRIDRLTQRVLVLTGDEFGTARKIELVFLRRN